MWTTIAVAFLWALGVYGLSAWWQQSPALASFGMGNAMLLGLFARQPAWRSRYHYAAVCTANALALWLLGGQVTGPLDAMAWALADAAGLWVGVRLLDRLPAPILQMRREQSPWLVLLACLAASLVSTCLHGPLLLADLPSELPSTLPRTLLMALGTEFMNHVLVVPLMLSFTRQRSRPPSYLAHALPLLSLVLSEVLATLIGGPGAMAFTLPAFIWCALRYELFPTALLFAAFTLWKCAAFAVDHSPMAATYFPDVLALRLGLSLLWLGPLTVACSHASRNEVLERLHHASQHDYLTQTLVRATFLRRSDRSLARLRQISAPIAILMLDIDYFKQVNDQHGHGMGDTVLQGFARTLSLQLRQSDLVGRYGGEEFCVCLPGIDLKDALSVAERLRAATLAQGFTTPDGERLHVTVSVGLAHYAASALPASTETALADADALLYRAKSGGRNRVEHQAITAPEAAAQPGLAPAMVAELFKA